MNAMNEGEPDSQSPVVRDFRAGIIEECMGSDSSIRTINQFLKSLNHVGRGGFEGLAAYLCQSATGQRFRLSGSGQQMGQDAASEPGYGNRIKVEAKHYSKKSLDLRELTAELTQATMSGSDVDLWVLATSCAVSDQHARVLEQIARERHVEVLFLDVGDRGLPRFLVLMAAFPEAVENWMDLNDISFEKKKLRTALEQLAAKPMFEEACDQLLRKLGGSLLGYEDARQRAKRRFLEVMGDEGTAKAVFAQSVAVRGQSARRISRVGVNDALSTWWTESSVVEKRAVVLGEEGTGKTWAVMGWVVDRIEADSLPIVLPFSAFAESITAATVLRRSCLECCRNGRRSRVLSFGLGIWRDG